jgi:hypothetical protein
MMDEVLFYLVGPQSKKRISMIQRGRAGGGIWKSKKMLPWASIQNTKTNIKEIIPTYPKQYPTYLIIRDVLAPMGKLVWIMFTLFVAQSKRLSPCSLVC